MIIYNKLTGKIEANIPETQDFDMFIEHYPEDEKANLTTIVIENPPIDLENYKIENGVMVKREIEVIEEPNKPIPTNAELLDKIKGLENIIDVMLGVDTNAL